MQYYPKGDYLFKLVQDSCRHAAGMPLSVQVVGRPFQEELVLHAMKEVEKMSNYVHTPIGRDDTKLQNKL